jgi:hypothetical protein
MNRSWSAGVRLDARVRACWWEFEPETYRVRMDDTFDQARHMMAARHLRMNLPSYLLSAPRTSSGTIGIWCPSGRK